MDEGFRKRGREQTRNRQSVLGVAEEIGIKGRLEGEARNHPRYLYRRGGSYLPRTAP